jgi:hypothetical protein
MKTLKYLLPTILMACCFAIGPAIAQESEQTEESGGFLKGIFGIIGDAAKESLEESIDEFIGKYEGRLGEVKLIERRGNAVVLDVTYDKVKSSDGVHVKGEVLKWGQPLEGFSNSLTEIHNRSGSVRLTIGFTPEGDQEWGTQQSEAVSDQIRLSLIRETHPERPFGEILYDIPKTWTNSDEPDELPTPEEETEGIELAEDETLEGSTAETLTAPVKPGMVLVPTAKVQQPNISTVKNTTATTSTLKRTVRIQSYDFYTNASKATWRSVNAFKPTNKGNVPLTLPFPGQSNDKRGFVRILSKGTLNPGTAAVNLLQTHPRWVSNGWIMGEYPAMVLGENVRFKSVVGFLKGANNSDGAIFEVLINENGKLFKVLSRKVSNKRHVSLDADLSKWAGKKVQIVLKVKAGNNSSQDWAVWVKPRLTK